MSTEVAEFKRLFKEYESSKPKRRRKSTKPTNDLTRAVIKLLRSKKYYAARVNTMGVYDATQKRWKSTNSTKGFPDVVGIVQGYFVGVEIKVGTDRQSDAQKHQEKLINKAGGWYLIVRDIDSFVGQLEEIENYIQIKGK